MKKIKLLSCLILSIFLVGCSATYNVNIKKGEVEENFKFSEKDNTIFNAIVFDHTDLTYKQAVMDNYEWPLGSFYSKEGNPYEPVKVPGVEYYEQQLINTNNELGTKYNYTFKLEDYNESNAVRSCFKNFSFGVGDQLIKIYAKNASYCFYGRKMLEDVKINLKTEYKVVEHNADKVKKGVYTWNINSGDAEDKKIVMTLAKDDNYVTEEEKRKESNSIMVLVIIFGIFLAILGSIVGYIYYKNKKLNKI